MNSLYVHLGITLESIENKIGKYNNNNNNHDVDNDNKNKPKCLDILGIHANEHAV